MTTAATPLPKRHEYLVGDLQGCHAGFNALLTLLDFDPQQDRLWLTGDLVARGEDSLATLRQVKALAEQGALHTVLGNHDLNLIAAWRGVVAAKQKDRTRPILDAPDADALMHWLRRQPLLLQPTADSVLVHAGLPVCWTVADAKRHALALQGVLAGPLDGLDDFLQEMYGDQPDVWDEGLQGGARLRLIASYLTRMRLTDAAGRLELTYKAGLEGPFPKGFAPWFDWPATRLGPTRVFFGHWAALLGVSGQPHAIALDGGCVWGHCLMAYRLSDGQRFSSSSGCGR